MFLWLVLRLVRSQLKPGALPQWVNFQKTFVYSIWCVNQHAIYGLFLHCTGTFTHRRHPVCGVWCFTLNGYCQLWWRGMLLYPYSSQLFSCFTTKFKVIILEEPIKNGDLAIDFLFTDTCLECHFMSRSGSTQISRSKEKTHTFFKTVM